jgi:Tfp pilus assembly protein PilX
MDKPNTLRRAAALQRGAAALIVTMLLLFTSSIIVFYLNRGLIFEQKTSANQVRSTSAFEMAEAGIEWATGMLNTDSEITTACAVGATTTATFRARYILPAGNAATAAATNTYPGCKVNGTALTCSCPLLAGANDEAVAALGTAVQPGFTVTFTNVPGDTTSVRVTSTGCTAQAGACKPATVTTTPAATNAATTNASDAWAQVSVIMKLRPLLRAAPSAALTCGTSCAVGGSYNIYNYEVASNGYLVNAGTTITSGPGTSYGTIPGQPIQNAMIAADASLSTLGLGPVQGVFRHHDGRLRRVAPSHDDPELHQSFRLRYAGQQCAVGRRKELLFPRRLVAEQQRTVLRDGRIRCRQRREYRLSRRYQHQRQYRDPRSAVLQQRQRQRPRHRHCRHFRRDDHLRRLQQQRQWHADLRLECAGGPELAARPGGPCAGELARFHTLITGSMHP